MSHGRAIALRRLSKNDLRLAQGIDVSEDGQSLFRYSNGRLIPEPQEWHRPAWDARQWEDKIATWAQVLQWDVVIGAFDGATLAGMASLRYRLTETVAQLVSLHVSRAYRRHGVATRLLHELMRLARQRQARELYVSAAPTPSAIGFYTRHGFAPAAHVNQRLYDLEPEDIHMTLTL
jgi:ribosomal protein S18 acetylase RimI-like enzyme